MSEQYTLAALRRYGEKIEKFADAFGLDHFPQEFTLISVDEMRQYLSYAGILPRYRHWSFGKAYDRFATLERYGLAPAIYYELVINASPSRAWLLQGNSLTTQLLVMAHVFAHNNFFKNNFLFRETHPDRVHEVFREHADTIEELVRLVGEEPVEAYLTAAHSLRNQRIAVPGLSGHSGGYNLIRFLIEEHPNLRDWQRTILEIVDEEWEHFIPHIETKIMNEGWAAYWHKQIFESLKVPSSMGIEFIDINTSVVYGIAEGMLNPYFLGISIFNDIKERWDRMASGDIRDGEVWDGLSGTEKMFEVMRTMRDTEFIRTYLTRELVEKCRLFAWKKVDDTEVEVAEVADDEGWENVRDTLIQNTALRAFPVIHVVDKNWQRRGELYLRHEDDGRNLHRDYTNGTLRNLFHIWGRPVHLETITYNKRNPYRHDYDGKTHRQGRVKDQSYYKGPNWEDALRLPL